jgi:hypothetical protein
MLEGLYGQTPCYYQHPQNSGEHETTHPMHISCQAHADGLSSTDVLGLPWTTGQFTYPTNLSVYSTADYRLTPPRGRPVGSMGMQKDYFHSQI